MTITVNDQEYRVRFRHEVKKFVNEHRLVCCTINDGEEEYALCNPKDQFCKATGRKIALARALKNMNFDKPSRRQFWAEYFRLTNKQYKTK